MSDSNYRAGAFDSEGHRRLTAHIPSARANELVPVADPRRPDFNQDFVACKRTRVRELQGLNWTAKLSDPSSAQSNPEPPRRASHSPPPTQASLGRCHLTTCWPSSMSLGAPREACFAQDGQGRGATSADSTNRPVVSDNAPRILTIWGLSPVPAARPVLDAELRSRSRPKRHFAPGSSPAAGWQRFSAGRRQLPAGMSLSSCFEVELRVYGKRRAS